MKCLIHKWIYKDFKKVTARITDSFDYTRTKYYCFPKIRYCCKCREVQEALDWNPYNLFGEFRRKAKLDWVTTSYLKKRNKK